MANIGRNDPCSCGSGRKYKHCHGNPAGQPTNATGSPALSKAVLLVSDVEHILAGHSGAAGLWKDISSFYGSKLDVRAAEPNGSSRFHFDLDSQSLVFNRAIIELSKSKREAAALVHELLHLRQPVRGFPYIRSLSLTSVQRKVASTVLETLNKAKNVIEHEIFIGDFRALGFRTGDFLALEPQPDYDKFASRQIREDQKSSIKKDHPEYKWITWSWWAMEFLRQEISIGHRESGGEGRLAEEAERAACRLYPEFDRCTDRIREWIAGGAYRTPERNAGALQTLMTLMMLPPISAFTTLARTDQGLILRPYQPAA